MRSTVALRALGAAASSELCQRLEPVVRAWAKDWFVAAPEARLAPAASAEAAELVVLGARGEERLEARWPEGAVLEGLFGAEGHALSDPRTAQVVGAMLIDLVQRLLGDGATVEVEAAAHAERAATPAALRSLCLRVALGDGCTIELVADGRLRDRWCPRRPATKAPLAARGETAAAAHVGVEAAVALGRFPLGEVAALGVGDVLLGGPAAATFLRTADGRIALAVDPCARAGRRAVVTRKDQEKTKNEGAR